MEHIGKVIFDIPFMIESHAESMKKSWELFRIYTSYEISQSSPISQIMAGLDVSVLFWILKGSQDFFHSFSMALYHKRDDKNDFAYVLQFFSLISDSLGSVSSNAHRVRIISKANCKMNIGLPL